ncbi:hypothetical protein BU24DRAFT_452958 [Aaosphaeria arxii CBS 175.79]|uniref:Aminoglycoside phosphotransferase domain-containing protein n=1 Tax=Aaosphaeria arxii CBS 175.79 TaxID=1450172 RepID=A0A6A5XI68_9PLEO|nr:uncharacterized protein BU24DRAFT_452958 [Aaosphaeria arxii CBS 175.79]KAF2012569.1 hypothetical protein BU24DRAFT_452958 [Aaosphaeria arxii CBS 175.79]
MNPEPICGSGPESANESVNVPASEPDSIEMMQHDSLKLGNMVDANDEYDTTLFPYYADNVIKARLPTAVQIEEHIAKTTDRHRLYGSHFRTDEQLMISFRGGWRMGPYVIKVGDTAAIFQEAENLLYLERNSTVRVQKLYAAFQGEGLERLPPKGALPKWQMYYYMVMEGLHGFETMEQLSFEISYGRPFHLQKKFCELFGEQLRKLRSIRPNDPNHYGRINGRKYMSAAPLFHTYCTVPGPRGHEDYSQYGPFNYEELIERFVQVALRINDSRLGSPMTPEKVREMSQECEMFAAKFLEVAYSQDKVPVLTHLHVHHANTVAKVIRDKITGALIDIEEVLLINWEHMAWMPSWYEPGDMLTRMGYVPSSDYGGLRDSAFYRALNTMGHVNMAFVPFSADFMEDFELRCHVCRGIAG